MKVTCRCSSSKDEPSTSSRASTKLRRIPPERGLQQLQLTEYKNGEIIELRQQDFFILRKEQFEKTWWFRDPLFPKELFLNSGEEALRPKDIVMKPQEPVLFIDNKKPFRVKQGSLGDCWFIVGLVHLEYYPNLFKFIVSPYEQTFDVNIYAGIFHFRFWQAGIWVDVVIDDRLPTEEEELVYASSGYPNEFWPALIEKAYAKLMYRSYKKLDGGFSRISMQDLSGGISETYIVKATSKILFKIIQDAKDRSTMISCGTRNENKFKKLFGKSVFNIGPGHSYAVTSVKIVKGDKAGIIGEFRLIRIRDPYGEKSVDLHHGNIKDLFTEATLASKLDTEIDEESWILYDDFVKYFSYVEICNLTPNQITNHVYSNTGKKLALSAIEGKFMGAVTSEQVAYNDFFTINPQYRMVLTKSDEVLIGVSLKRRHDVEKISISRIFFEIISFDGDDTTRVPQPLFTSFIEPHKFGPFKSRGQVGKRIDLEPEKIQKYSPIENGENLNKVYHKMFDQLWKNKQEKKYKRQADEPADNERSFKKIKI
ncbi:calpain-A-like [Aphidius gifuensis]|uniref:calpain-A-like n=1 Tax=Aphidius gifuensis TaxID=684658 RepID=UPI001CDD644B|nr:calpain-A-like [Aphidius gifuensis]